MTDDERPLRLDAPREEALAHAARLVEEAWNSFDRFRPEEPPLDDRVRALIRADLPEDAASVHEALDDAARILDESIAQPRPRYFAFIGSGGGARRGRRARARARRPSSPPPPPPPPPRGGGGGRGWKKPKRCAGSAP